MISTGFISVAFLVAVLLFSAKKKVQRERACFALYAVRDEFVCLVAEGKLSEDSPVFRHFYGRINSYLSRVPNVGYDDLLQTLLRIKPSADLDSAMAVARKRIDTVKQSDDMQRPEVKRAVAQYFDAVARLMASHSSFSRTIFFRLAHVGGLMPVWRSLTPRLWGMLRVAQFAEDRSAELQPHHSG
jgi:hypothetical protein